MKLLSIPPSAFTLEIRMALLNQFPKRVLLRLCDRHNLPATADNVVYEVASRPQLINLIKLSIDFKLL